VIVNYFKREEFKCPCCGEIKVSDELLHRLNMARDIYGKAMVVSSGYRCPKHNAEVGGVPSSAHMTGDAADIRCYGVFDRYNMINAFYNASFLRIGIAESFIHVDVSLNPVHPQNVVWVYAKED
jgi:uncharacterized protein YcbK (DUF882 family)